MEKYQKSKKQALKMSNLNCTCIAYIPLDGELVTQY